jgi:hypothetical protein
MKRHNWYPLHNDEKGEWCCSCGIKRRKVTHGWVFTDKKDVVQFRHRVPECKGP